MNAIVFDQDGDSIRVDVDPDGADGGGPTIDVDIETTIGGRSDNALVCLSVTEAEMLVEHLNAAISEASR